MYQPGLIVYNQGAFHTIQRHVKCHDVQSMYVEEDIQSLSGLVSTKQANPVTNCQCKIDIWR